eukprot:TRINITY_DN1094_c0_g1_i1.p1 TRINITY_DN1094_c0_g1~~TRINITY_DN1094_c0_g1_i1.p1  ORF type:complete len:205 (+),score=43.77 TRINITY_DN1094_c0_g1_i1:70-684(+)
MCFGFFFFFQAEDGIRDVERSRGLGDVYKRQVSTQSTWDIRSFLMFISYIMRKCEGEEPSMTTYTKCLICCFSYFTINLICCAIVYMVDPEGHYNQMILTLRPFSFWGVLNGLAFVGAVIAGKTLYHSIMKYIIKYLTYLYEIMAEFLVLFFIACIISYHNFIFITAGIFGITSVVLAFLSMNLLEKIYATSFPKYIPLRPIYL